MIRMILIALLAAGVALACASTTESDTAPAQERAAKSEPVRQPEPIRHPEDRGAAPLSTAPSTVEVLVLSFLD